MKYIALVMFMVFISACDFKKVDEGKSIPKSAMKCGTGKCGAKMFDENLSVEKKQKASVMKCGADKCGAVKIDTH